MADNVVANTSDGLGATFATDDIASVHYPLTKVVWGPLNTATLVDTGAGAVPIQDGGNSITVDGTVAATQSGTWNITNVSGTVSLPTGAATAAKQPALGTAGTASADVITVQGIASMTALKVDGTGGSFPVTDSAGSLTVDAPVGTPVFVRLSDGAAAITNLASNIAQIGGNAVSAGNGASGTGVLRVTLASDSTGTLAGVTTVTTLTGGGVAHDGADSGNPVKIGGRAVSAELAAVANNDRADFVTDLTGKQIVLPYANPENFVSGAITTAMTGTTSTSLIGAPGAGLRNYITQITVSNAHATVGTDVVIQDGSGGTTLYTLPAAAAYGGASITFNVPLRQPTTNTALFCANVTTGASTKVSASGYKGA